MARNGKAFNEYLHQAAPGADVVSFSDKPLTVAGVRYYPKWAWSDGYRKWFRAGHGAPKSIFDRTEYAYRRWLINERALSQHEATVFINRQRQAA